MALFKIYHGTRKTISRFRESVLQRVVGIGTLFSSGYGDVGPPICFAPGVTTVYAGGGSLFPRRASGDGWAFFAGWALLLDYVITLWKIQTLSGNRPGFPGEARTHPIPGSRHEVDGRGKSPPDPSTSP